MTKINFLNLLLAATIFLGAAQLAHSSPPACTDGFIVPPFFLSYNPHTSQLPTNIGGFLWKPTWHVWDESNTEKDPTKHVALYQMGEHESKVEVAITKWESEEGVYVISPTRELAAGVNYELRVSHSCGHLSDPAEISKFVATEHYEFPSLLGEINALPTVMEEVGIGSPCLPEAALAARKEFKLVLAADFIPWAEAAFVTASIDGKPTDEPIRVDSSSGLAHFSSSVFQTCEGRSAGIGEGPHTIAFHAKLPGTDVTLSTPDLSFALSCSSENTDTKTSSVLSVASGPAIDFATTPTVDQATIPSCQGTGIMPLALLIIVSSLTKRLRR